MNYKELLTFKPYFSVKQHIPGRLRLKFSLKILDLPEAKSILQEKKEIPEELGKVRLNKFARSLIIEYSPDKLPFEMLENLLNATTPEDGEQALSQLEQHLSQNRRTR